MSKICKICGENKSKDEFYSTSGLTCKQCKKKLDVERAKDARNNNTNMLKEILDNQRNMEKTLLSRIDEMETEINKLRKKLKKTSFP